MKYYSTNRRSIEVDFKTAVLNGQPPDGGLYMIKNIPKLSKEDILSFKNFNLKQIALKILSSLINDAIPKNNLKEIIDWALNFEISIENIDNNCYVCYLDKGPTASFKDFGARVLAKMMEYFLEKEKKEIIILTATSGDTGGAVASAFHGMKRIKVIILYPKNEISELQRKQMTTLGNNILALGIKGKFDNCQQYVKKAFSDDLFNDLNLTSANSINLGRLFPQSIYYFYSYSRVLQRDDDKVIFSVPSGNFGNLLAGLISYKMGLPVVKFIAAVNENDEFPKFLYTGKYKKIEPSKKCISSAMNVGNPSNLSRIFDLYDGWLDELGNVKKQPNLGKLKNDIISFSISDDETRVIISEFYKKYKKIIDPHGAVGWGALLKFLKKYPKYQRYKSICFETADPAKFSQVISSILGFFPEKPNSLKSIATKREYNGDVNIQNYLDFKNFLQKKYKQ